MLGAAYELTRGHTDPDSDGYTNQYSREIVVRTRAQLLDEEATDADREERERHCLRHELVHAFLFESGLNEYSYDETLVDWIAAKIPAMVEAMQKVKAL